MRLDDYHRFGFRWFSVGWRDEIQQSDLGLYKWDIKLGPLHFAAVDTGILRYYLLSFAGRTLYYLPHSAYTFSERWREHFKPYKRFVLMPY